MRLRIVMSSVLLLAGWAVGQQSVPGMVQKQVESAQNLQQQARADLPASKSSPGPFMAKPAAVPQPVVASSVLGKTAVMPARKPKAIQSVKPVSAPAGLIAAAVPKKRDIPDVKGQRDPFVSIIQTPQAAAPHCSIGKQCLVVDQIVLRGVVKSQEGMLAVVENSQKKSYFLRKGDPVFNGQVVRITDTTIVFRERVLDRRGQELSREVVKRVAGTGPAA